MTRTPVVEHFLVQFLMGLLVIAAMSVGGEAGGRLLGRLAVPYADVVGVLLGSLAVFLGVAALYARQERAGSAAE